ncbi:MAG: DUF481 domain-containing protein [Holophagales bacterium]|jgi:putative salt-induced outer membrane protein YdiY|nr:DUF481 domain-containing protein [Holophagales bacterium]
MSNFKITKLLLILISYRFAICQTPPAASAQKARTWSNIATLSFVATSGNSSVDTIGFSNDFIKRWNLMTLTFKSGILRSETSLTRVTTTGNSLDDAPLQEFSTSSVTAENYFLNARFDYRLKDKDRWYWYSGSSWERNLPVGLSSRTTVTGGVGRIVTDSNKTRWRMDTGIGITREEPTFPPPGFQRGFATFNLTSSLKHKFNENANYSADLSSSCNLKEFQDWLSVFKQGLTLTVTRTTAMKIGFDINYRNMPSLISVKVYSADSPSSVIGNLISRAKKLDTTATTSLVISF